MTDRKQALTDLLEKVEWGGDQYGFGVLGGPTIRGYADSAFNGSLDAAKALHEAVLHEAAWASISYSKRYEDEARAEITLDKGTWQARADNPARACLIAILKALIAEEDT